MLDAYVYIMVGVRESASIESSTVKSATLARRMRVVLSSAERGLPLLLLLLVALLHLTEIQAEHTSCPKENCVSAGKCTEPIVNGVCEDNTKICCSVVRSEFRTHCRHHGGECMKSCSKTLRREVVDCPADKQCCVLV